MNSTRRHSTPAAIDLVSMPIMPAANDAETPLSAVGLAAVGYVSQWRWPLVVGADALTGHGRCGLGVGGGILEATTDPVRVQAWWRRWPSAGIVACSGGRFDIVTVPASAGRHVLDRLTTRGDWLGPVLADDDIVAFLVAPDQGRQWLDLIAAYGGGHSHRGTGQLILLPPSSPNNGGLLRWVVPPTTANVPRLPCFDDLGELIIATRHRYDSRWLG